MLKVQIRFCHWQLARVRFLLIKFKQLAGDENCHGNGGMNNMRKSIQILVRGLVPIDDRDVSDYAENCQDTAGSQFVLLHVFVLTDGNKVSKR